MRFVKALAAFSVLVLIVAGPPVALIRFIGNPWPAEGVSLTAPLTDGALVGMLAVVVWVLWAQVTACIVAEALAALGGRGLATRVPFTLGVQQLLARRLVTAVVVVGIGAPGIAGVAQAAAPEAPRTSTSSALSNVASTSVGASSSGTVDTTKAEAAQESASDSEPAPALGVVTVMRLDSLWSIAERVLGDGERWTEIAELNEGRPMKDGSRFGAAGTIEPGWELLVPAEAAATSPHEVRVREGDTLSGLAQKYLGDAEQYPRIAEASAGIVQPHGERLDDPDLIKPGWTVRLPGVDGARPGEVPTADLPAQERRVVPPAPVVEEPASAEAHVPGAGVQGQDSRPQRRSDGGDEAVEDAPGPTASTAVVQDEDRVALQALLATATCLAAGAFVMVVRNRRRQFRQRGIGRAIAPTSPETGVVEETVLDAGVEAQADAEFVDRALRHVAATCVAREAALPEVAAAILGPDDLTLLLDEPADVPAPEGWTSTTDSLAWTLPRSTFLESSLDEQPAPYPAMVTVGHDSDGRMWMLDLEALGVVGIGGDQSKAESLIRFIITELAVNSWADGAEVLVGERFSETVAVNPNRVRSASVEGAIARADVVARDTEAATAVLGAGVLARRASGLVLDSTHPLVVVLPADRGEELRTRLSPTARSRTVVIHDDPTAPSIEVSSEGIGYLPRWGVSLTAMAMSKGQADAIGDLLATTRTMADVPMADGDPDGALGPYAKVDGSLRDAFRTDRSSEGANPTSLLPLPDEEYLTRAATTADDLAEMAPGVLEAVADELEVVDPELDRDWADWWDTNCHRPKVHLLGPVEVYATNGGDSSTLSNLAGTTSFLAFLACRDRGVTGEAAAAAFGWQTQRTVQNRATDARYLLGTRPDGTDWLPDATKTEGARRGSPTYELDRGPGGVLIDADLFRRLRFRAMKRGRSGGRDDLLKALDLVRGAPFEAATDRRYPWLFRGQRVDEVMVCAIEDVAHLVATSALAEGDPATARHAAEIAQRANPHGDAAWLDVAAALSTEGASAEADSVLRERLGSGEEDLMPRTEQILDQRNWLAS